MTWIVASYPSGTVNVEQGDNQGPHLYVIGRYGGGDQQQERLVLADVVCALLNGQPCPDHGDVLAGIGKESDRKLVLGSGLSLAANGPFYHHTIYQRRGEWREICTGEAIQARWELIDRVLTLANLKEAMP